MQLTRSGLAKALLLSTAVAGASAFNFESNCNSFAKHLKLANTTVWFSEYVPANTNLTFPDNDPTCTRPSQVVSADMCRIAMYVATSNRSGISMEAWLPRDYNDRFLSTGNGGVSGCIQYEDLAYTSALGFATVGANNGHNGTSGRAFLNNPDVVLDFASRSIHTNVVLGKQIAQQFYGKHHKKSYYLGCSTGGRQGFKSAQMYPGDFDGIVAGAPAVAFNNLSSWSGNFYKLTGDVNSTSFIPFPLWNVIYADVLRQCDGLDGAVDGIIEDPMLCQYRPEALMCGAGNTTVGVNCLTAAQVETVRGIFSPLYGTNGTLVFPAMQPGSEVNGAQYIYYTGMPFPYTSDWYRYAVYNNPNWDPATLNPIDYDNAWRINPGNISTWEGDLSAYENRGGKILQYHGQADQIITSFNSPRYYDFVSRTMGLSSSKLDDFYRFFRISGMGHCSGGPGAWMIGQTGAGNATLAPEANVLMAMVQWVEKGTAPEYVQGTKYVNDTASLGVSLVRKHCKWPTRNHYIGGPVGEASSWACQPAYGA